MAVEQIIDEKELEAAQKEAEKAGSMEFVHVLKKPFTFEGHTMTELRFDFSSLTGEDALAIEDELAARGKQVIVPAFNGHFLICLAARACTTTFPAPGGGDWRPGADALKKLPIGEFNRIRSKTRNFFMSTE